MGLGAAKCGSIFGAITALLALSSLLVGYGAEAITINELDVGKLSLLTLVFLGVLRALTLIKKKIGDVKSSHREEISDVGNEL